jgi:hypothetical protein
MFEAKSLDDALGGQSFKMIGSDGGFNAQVAAGLTRQGLQVSAPGLASNLTNRFALSSVNLDVGQGGALQSRAEPGMAPAQPVVAARPLQPQNQFS